MFAALLAFLLTLPSALAQTGFEGTWVLDLPASQSVDEVLRLQGVAWAERKATDHLAVTHHVSLQDDVMTVVVQSASGTRTDVLYLDGRVEQRQAPRLGAVSTQSRRTLDRARVVTTTRFTLPEQVGGELVYTRSLLDANTMALDVSIRLDDGRGTEARRVFRRSP